MIKELVKKSINLLGYEIKKSSISLGDNFRFSFENHEVSSIIDNDLEAKIFVFFHKKYKFIDSNFYHNVGLGGFSEGMSSHDAQNLDNISHKNKHYCELTGLYHVWRNSVKPSILGTAHYRRYLNVLPLYGINNNGFLSLKWDQGSLLLKHPMQEKQVIKLLEEYDIIVPKSYFLNESLARHYINTHSNVEWQEFLRSLDFLYGSNSHSLRSDKRAFWGNIFIARREVFDKYCHDLFSAIDSVYASVGVPTEVANARYQPFRYPGYLAERFLTAFINSHRLKYYEADLVQINDL